MTTVTSKQILFFLLVPILFYVIGMIAIKAAPEKWSKSAVMITAALTYTILLVIAYYVGGVQKEEYIKKKGTQRKRCC